MRILSEIIDDVIDGKMPTHEECYWALQAYRYMLNIDHRMLRNELMKEERDSEFVRKEKAEISFKMYKGALSQPPKNWCGEKSY